MCLQGRRRLLTLPCSYSEQSDGVRIFDWMLETAEHLEICSAEKGLWCFIVWIRCTDILFVQGYPPADLKQALALEESMRHLIISYIGIDLMSPEAFPHPPGYVVAHIRSVTDTYIHATYSKAIGAPEFTSMLLSLSSFAASPYASSGPAGSSLSPSEIESLLSDIVWRFDPDGELESVLGPVVIGLLHHECLFSPEGIASADSLWRGVVGGLEVLVANKSVVKMMCMMEEWCANDADAPNVERASLLGPLLRLNVFPTEWVSID